MASSGHGLRHGWERWEQRAMALKSRIWLNEKRPKSRRLCSLCRGVVQNPRPVDRSQIHHGSQISIFGCISLLQDMTLGPRAFTTHFLVLAFHSLEIMTDEDLRPCCIKLRN